jgi:hypothetical protein
MSYRLTLNQAELRIDLVKYGLCSTAAEVDQAIDEFSSDIAAVMVANGLQFDHQTQNQAVAAHYLLNTIAPEFAQWLYVQGPTKNLERIFHEMPSLLQ